MRKIGMKALLTASRILMVLATCLATAACQTETQPKAEQAKSPTPKLTEENFLQRAEECRASYPDLKGKPFADCLEGRAFTQNQVCAESFKFLGNPWVSDWEKAAVLELMKKRNCI
jgi:hypothetical protein